MFFDSNPSATTFTNNAALDIADSDIDRIIGVVSVAATDYAAFSDNSVATVKGIAMPYQCVEDEGTVYVAFVSRGTPTYALRELSCSIGTLQDA